MKDIIELVEKHPILHVTHNRKKEIEGSVIREAPLTVFLNNKKLTTLLCYPKDIDYLTAGFLFSEGLIKGKDDIINLTVDNKNSAVHVETREKQNNADASTQKAESQMQISAGDVLSLVHRFEHSSPVYLATHGAHSAALCDTKNILLFTEDVGRHNAIDKIFGECILKNIPTRDRLMITSGRIFLEILHKVARWGIPILISRAVPTNLGLRLADELGITLIGYVRKDSMNVYTHGWRVVTDGENEKKRS